MIEAAMGSETCETTLLGQERTDSPGPILLLGAPGVGKGTQAQLLVNAFAIPQVSTGDLLRQHRRDHTALGLLADDLMQRGVLVPDDLVNKMVAGRLSESDCRDGYILDGFPRTLAQAAWLDEFVAAAPLDLPVVAISIRVDHDELLRRITGRRICPDGHIYNIYTQPPIITGQCDLDGKPLNQRNDDSEAVFEERMRTFYTQTAPVVDHYRSLGRFVEVDGSVAIPQVTDGIESALVYLRRGLAPATEA